MKNIHDDIERVIFSQADIHAMVQKLGEAISRDYVNKNPLLVCVLKGSAMVMADLMRAISVACEIDFMVVSSYVGTRSKGAITIIKDLSVDIAGRDVIIVEDIVDSGVTLNSLAECLRGRHPSSLKICALLDKPSGRTVAIQADYVGGEVGNDFIVGYGLDYNEKYRNLPYIGVLKKSIYSHK